MRSDQDRLGDMLRAIDKAEKYKSEGEERFYQDELLQVWALHHLQIIAEAVAGLSEMDADYGAIRRGPKQNALRARPVGLIGCHTAMISL